MRAPVILARRIPKSNAPAGWWPKAAGFTFLELLLVIIVIGIIAGLVMPTLFNDEASRLLQRSVERALAVMALQEEEAVLSGRQVGLLLTRQRGDDGAEAFHYRWYEWSAIEANWVEAAVPARFNGSFDAVTELAFSLDGQDVKVPEDAQNLRPQIVIFPSGEVTEFELRLVHIGVEDRSSEWVVLGGFDGIKLSDENEE